MSKQYMTITNNSGEMVTIKTNSEKAIKMAIKKLNKDGIGGGAVKSIEIKGNVIKYTYTEEAAYWGYWQPTSKSRVFIVENTFVTEETAEVVEVEAPAIEVCAAYTILPKYVVKATPAAEVVEVEAPARIVEDVDTSYDDDAIDEALDAIRDAIISGRSYAHLIETAQDLGATRHAISEVITDAKSEATA